MRISSWALAGALAGALLLGGCAGPGPVGSGVAAAASATAPAGPTAAALDWTVEIVQAGETLPGPEQISLARAPFTIRARLPQPWPIKLNAFNTDENFQVLRPGFVFDADCERALCTGMDVAEERQNVDQNLFVDAQLTHYLYYQGPDDNRWSRATVEPAGAVLERDVARLNDAPVEDYPDPALYLLLFVNPANPDQIDPGEVKTLTLIFK
jgi:hypothetical protein